MSNTTSVERRLGHLEQLLSQAEELHEISSELDIRYREVAEAELAAARELAARLGAMFDRVPLLRTGFAVYRESDGPRGLFGWRTELRPIKVLAGGGLAYCGPSYGVGFSPGGALVAFASDKDESDLSSWPLGDKRRWMAPASGLFGALAHRWRTQEYTFEVGEQLQIPPSLLVEASRIALQRVLAVTSDRQAAVRSV